VWLFISVKSNLFAGRLRPRLYTEARPACARLRIGQDWKPHCHLCCFSTKRSLWGVQIFCAEEESGCRERERETVEGHKCPKYLLQSSRNGKAGWWMQKTPSFQKASSGPQKKPRKLLSSTFLSLRKRADIYPFPFNLPPLFSHISIITPTSWINEAVNTKEIQERSSHQLQTSTQRNLRKRSAHQVSFLRFYHNQQPLFHSVSPFG
jgi:hypothetical protein